MVAQLRLRPAARAVILDDQDRVLLVHFDFGAAAELPTGLWACPGGGIEPNESVPEGLRRELREEVGLQVDDIGQPIWHKEHVFPFGNWDGQRDTYYLIEVQHFDPHPALSMAELRAENVDGLRWWSLAELQLAQHAYDAAPRDATRLTFSPRRLGHLLADLVSHGRPREPLALER
jgi:8-oxo-dGTP pyrophosphatase MutT (NUDIX family)